ncbi:hypothetical protein [Synechococcus sp. PCC 7336]|uniref:hypothetical protein n=1 Tax=Synechococcus sp. PCC 7336 TaxID=195250 RepID=UPI00034C9F42|nr:hypothetical protein [Synechococcus sp. PCC 7336]
MKALPRRAFGLFRATDSIARTDEPHLHKSIMTYETRKILIVTKTYPEISTKYFETVCTAGILLDDAEWPLQWIRIYPIRFRELDSNQRYAKWSIISAAIEKNPNDNRAESYRIKDDSIEIVRRIDTSNGWEERRQYFEPLIFRSIDDIKAQSKSLGAIKPTITGYLYEETDRDWPSAKQAILDQGDLFRDENPFSNLEKIPYKFFYRFTDEGGLHKCSIIDWEIAQLYRSMKRKSGKPSEQGREEEALEKVRIKLMEEFLPKDLYFLMGNIRKYPQNFVIIGIIYPPQRKPRQLKLNLLS